MLALYPVKSTDFTVQHFHEQMQKRNNYKLRYTGDEVASAPGRAGQAGASAWPPQGAAAPADAGLFGWSIRLRHQNGRGGGLCCLFLGFYPLKGEESEPHHLPLAR